MIMTNHPDDKKPVVEYTAKITLPNGEVIEKLVSAMGGRQCSFLQQYLK